MNSSERKYRTAWILNDKASCLYRCHTYMVVWDIDCLHGLNKLYFGVNDVLEQRWPHAGFTLSRETVLLLEILKLTIIPEQQ